MRSGHRTWPGSWTARACASPVGVAGRALAFRLQRRAAVADAGAGAPTGTSSPPPGRRRAEAAEIVVAAVRAAEHADPADRAGHRPLEDPQHVDRGQHDADGGDDRPGRVPVKVPISTRNSEMNELVPGIAMVASDGDQEHPAEDRRDLPDAAVVADQLASRRGRSACRRR